MQHFAKIPSRSGKVASGDKKSFEKLEVFNEVKTDCVWHEKQQAELKEAAMPLVKYLRTHCTPMHVAIVDVAGVDLYAKDINVTVD